ncbi:uncharacterized protein LOC114866677 [Betta splendens]|uniref:Uncharacterized protein LOC114866677 n=1 Tax=Betta splendens TaxID=158456 RepID=A0A9W2XGN2_BETSP|nr:uncharacterized protein LOC114866677 [Betta splendens]
MTPPNFALCFACLFVSSAASTVLHQQSLWFEPSNVGATVTLPCLCQDDAAVMFYWYKQTLGQIPMLVLTSYKHRENVAFHGEFKTDRRFSLDIGNLKISELRMSDSATYYCVKSNLYDFEFCEGITVIVKELRPNVPALVHQSVFGSIQPGGSVTLNCLVQTGTCDGQHSVYWFKDSGEARPGIIYTHGDRNDQCERNPDTQTHTCVYDLPLQSLNASHAGTYYCAVASCGHILFGNGTKLDFKNKAVSPGDAPASLNLVYFLSCALTFTTILAVFLAFFVCKLYKGPHSNVTFSPSANTEDEQNLHYAAFREVDRSRKLRDEAIMSECVYSSVKQ